MARRQLRPREAVEIWDRDDGHCYWCRDRIDLAAGFEIDHYMPVALGGTDDLWNLVISCRPCNRTKVDLHPRVAIFMFHWGVPKAVAIEMHHWELGGPDLDMIIPVPGAHAYVHPDDRREFLRGPRLPVDVEGFKDA